MVNSCLTSKIIQTPRCSIFAEYSRPSFFILYFYSLCHAFIHILPALYDYVLYTVKISSQEEPTNTILFPSDTVFFLVVMNYCLLREQRKNQYLYFVFQNPLFFPLQVVNTFQYIVVEIILFIEFSGGANNVFLKKMEKNLNHDN